MDHNNIIESGGFYFIHCFDSGNLGHVERVPTELIAPSVNNKTNTAETPDYEFNLWTRPDCAGTEFENGNRTWFYFGVQASEPNALVRLNLINLNKQGKMYNQGMAPVTRTLPGKPQWERIRDRPIHSTDDNTFTLSFKYRTSDNLKATTFFAFTYPFSFAELQIALNSIDLKMLPLPSPQSLDEIYYYRECLIYSLEGRRVDLLTLTSHHGITTEREERLKNLFPDNKERPFKFQNKKVIFISARVHPGETPSSFVFNGFLNLLLTRYDPIAIQLRKLYVFKMIPFLNPDGVARGHYRTDTRGVNLNRVYLNPSLTLHPTVYASRALIRYYHFGCEKEDNLEDSKSFTTRSIHDISESCELIEIKKKKLPSTASYKSVQPKRDKEKNKQIGTNKSTTTLKQPSASDNSRKGSSDAATLVDQVNDMKLQELPARTSPISSQPSKSNVRDEGVLLTDTVLKRCLGSDVHVTTSEELNLPGSNPLRPLRDTLKNSISLLMESCSSVASDRDSIIGSKESPLANIRMGWCKDCQLALDRLEDTMPGYANMVPGYEATMCAPSNPTYSNIEEYREHQKMQYDAYERQRQELEEAKDETVYFCTNCFKRYVLTDHNEEIKVCGAVSGAGLAVSAGDSGSVRAADTRGTRAGSTGDAHQTAPISTKVESAPAVSKQLKKKSQINTVITKPKEPESGLYLYIDLHGHASKKGIFMYGNHFEELESCVECMLLPRIMSLNNLHFHFASCNFTEKNMYLKDRRDGMSREGSGRVAVYKATGLVRSYTLECNYNTGRLVNVLPPPVRDAPPAAASAPPPPPPKYTPHIFEEVGRSLGASILDLTSQHPNSRIPCSEHRNLSAVRDWLRAHTRTLRPQLTMSRLRPKASSPSRAPLYARTKIRVPDERKENSFTFASRPEERKRTPRSSHDLNKYAKTELADTSSRTKYLTDTEPKPKTLNSKKRNILAIRKPNASKTQVKAKVSRRSADEAESRPSLASKITKRSFSRATRVSSNRCRAMASSSSEDATNWEEVCGGTIMGEGSLASVGGASVAGRRRALPPAPPAPARLKKIRLKTPL